jgi:hypothetical protein
MHINKAIMRPSTQLLLFFSSHVIATTCFSHTTIIRRHTVVFLTCGQQPAGERALLYYDGRMTETCCGNNIGRGEEELLR